MIRARWLFALALVLWTGAFARDGVDDWIDATVLPSVIPQTSVQVLDRDGDLLDFDLAEVRVSKTIIRRARKTFLVCDHSKIDRSAPARLASLSELTCFFTDLPLPEELDRKCRDWGVQVVVAG